MKTIILALFIFASLFTNCAIAKADAEDLQIQQIEQLSWYDWNSSIGVDYTLQAIKSLESIKPTTSHVQELKIQVLTKAATSTISSIREAAVQALNDKSGPQAIDDSPQVRTIEQLASYDWNSGLNLNYTLKALQTLHNIVPLTGYVQKLKINLLTKAAESSIPKIREAAQVTKADCPGLLMVD